MNPPEELRELLEELATTGGSSEERSASGLSAGESSTGTGTPLGCAINALLPFPHCRVDVDQLWVHGPWQGIGHRRTRRQQDHQQQLLSWHVPHETTSKFALFCVACTSRGIVPVLAGCRAHVITLSRLVDQHSARRGDRLQVPCQSDR